MDNSEEYQPGIDIPFPKMIGYSYRIDVELFDRIQRQLDLIKRFEDRGFSKQRWVKEAAKEQLELEKTLSPKELGKEATITFKVDESLNEQIEESVKLIRRYRNSFSKRQWFIEAFYKKLARDEKKIKELLNKMRKTASHKASEPISE